MLIFTILKENLEFSKVEIGCDSINQQAECSCEANSPCLNENVQEIADVALLTKHVTFDLKESVSQSSNERGSENDVIVDAAIYMKQKMEKSFIDALRLENERKEAEFREKSIAMRKASLLHKSDADNIPENVVTIISKNQLTVEKSENVIDNSSLEEAPTSVTLAMRKSAFIKQLQDEARLKESILTLKHIVESNLIEKVRMKDVIEKSSKDERNVAMRKAAVLKQFENESRVKSQTQVNNKEIGINIKETLKLKLVQKEVQMRENMAVVRKSALMRQLEKVNEDKNTVVTISLIKLLS